MIDNDGQIPGAQPGRSDTGFQALASRFKTQQATLGELVNVLRVTTLFALRPPRPGLFTFQAPDSSTWTSVFTSIDRLARHLAERGSAEPADYFSTTGADFLDNLLPPGVGLLVDPGDEQAVALAPAWLGSLPPSAS